jgi:hypothetical protein
VRRGVPGDSHISIRGDLSLPLDVLRQHALHTARGQKIAYVVDIACHDLNIEKVIALARDADQLFIEAPFLDVDASIAAQRKHLTARQAGAIAKRAGVARLVTFHYSARYRDREDELRREAEEAFCAHPMAGLVDPRLPGELPNQTRRKKFHAQVLNPPIESTVIGSAGEQRLTDGRGRKNRIQS